jgi:hypothetical protein
MAGRYNIVIEQGATFDRLITWKDAAGSPIDLTGYSARMQLRASHTAQAVLIELTTGNGRIALGGVAGTVRLTIAAADTAALASGMCVYDLELVSGGGVVTRLLEGSCQVSPEVTR